MKGGNHVSFQVRHGFRGELLNLRFLRCLEFIFGVIEIIELSHKRDGLNLVNFRIEGLFLADLDLGLKIRFVFCTRGIL